MIHSQEIQRQFSEVGQSCWKAVTHLLPVLKHGRFAAFLLQNAEFVGVV